MLSFHNDSTLYQEWGVSLKKNGKGCYWMFNSYEYSHEKFAQKFDLPIFIPRLADVLFERAEPDEAKNFAIQIWEAMRVGVNYSKFTHHWHYWLICDPEWGVIRFNNDPRVEAVGILHKRSIFGTVDQAEWLVAGHDAANAAIDANDDLAAYAAYAAHGAYATHADHDVCYATYDADAAFASIRSRYRSAQRSKFLQLLRTVQ